MEQIILRLLKDNGYDHFIIRYFENTFSIDSFKKFDDNNVFLNIKCFDLNVINSIFSLELSINDENIINRENLNIGDLLSFIYNDDINKKQK